jgi:hypothetical protein
MLNRYKYVLLLALLTIPGLWLFSGYLSAQSVRLEAGRARELLRRLGGAELPSGLVRIKSVSPGISSSDAIVEAQIETAWRYARTGNEWQIAEVRLGDRQWESVELLTEAIRREKIRRTIISMQQIVEGLEDLKKRTSQYPATEEFSKVLDTLVPQYLKAMPGLDLWGSPYAYKGTSSDYRLISRGPDRTPGTADDIIFENSVRKSGTSE